MSLHYPVNLNIAGRKCLVIGGGGVALRKVKGLLECGAQVRVVSPLFHPSLENLAQEQRILAEKRGFLLADLDQVFLVIAATDDNELNHYVAKVCQEKNILINVVDDPAWCSFTLAALHRQGDLLVTVSTNGKSPALARVIKEDLARNFSPDFADALELLGSLRLQLMEKCSEEKKRGEILNQLINHELLQLIKEGQMAVVKERINSCIASLQA